MLTSTFLFQIQGWKKGGYPQFSLGIPIALAEIFFSHIQSNLY
jgi:hypothetical protein